MKENKTKKKIVLLLLKKTLTIPSAVGLMAAIVCVNDCVVGLVECGILNSNFIEYVPTGELVFIL